MIEEKLTHTRESKRERKKKRKRARERERWSERERGERARERERERDRGGGEKRGVTEMNSLSLTVSFVKEDNLNNRFTITYWLISLFTK